MNISIACHEQRTSMLSLSRNSVITLFASVILAFICHNAFMHLYYWRWFHSDSAAAYIVAQQILYEGKLFPSGFIFGNDLFLLRPQFAIALLMKLGMSGYGAYALATSLMFATAYGIVSFCLMLCQPKTKAPLIATCLLLIPVSMNEVDFILGQQSHLMQSSLALVASILFYRVSRGLAGRFAVLVLVLIITLLAVDSIMRALLATSAVVVVSLVIFPGNKRLYLTTGISILALAIGFAFRKLILLNTWLIGVSNNSALDLRWNTIARKLAELWSDIGAFVLSSNFWSFQDLGSALFTIATLVTVTFLVGITLWLVWISLTLMVNRVANQEVHQSDVLQQLVLIGVAGFVVALAGLAAATLTSLGPVVRHALPGIFMMKFILAWVIADACTSKQVNAYRVFGWCLAVSLILASPVTLAATSDFHRKSHHASQIANLHNALSKLRELEVVRSGQGRMYGEFWDAYRYAVLADTTLSPAPIQVSEGRVVSFNFLSIPERYCAVANQPNIFIVRKSDKKMIGAMSESASRVDLTPELDVFVESARDLEGCKKLAKPSTLPAQTATANNPHEAIPAAALPSLVGRVEGSARVATAPETHKGYLSYGPYMKLAPGRYEIVIQYGPSEGAHSWDVLLRDRKRHRLITKGLLEPTPHKDKRIVVPLTLTDAAEDVEVRSYYSGQGQLTLSAISIKPTPDQ